MTIAEQYVRFQWFFQVFLVVVALGIWNRFGVAAVVSYGVGAAIGFMHAAALSYLRGPR